MATTKHLRESASEAPTKRGNRWRVIVARPGVGSSGTYSEDVFRRDAHKIIAPGGQAFINHEADRNPKDMIGVYPEGSFWSEPDKAVVSELEVFSHWKEFVEEVGPHCGISLYALGEMDDLGNVTAFVEDRLNGADLVARPGLIGSGIAEKLYETAKERDSAEPGAKTSAQEPNERKPMDEETKKAFEALNARFDALVAEKQATQAADEQKTADEKAVSEAVDAYDAALEAIDKAELLDPQKEALRAEARESVKARKVFDPAPLIESAKKIKDAALEAVRATESAPGRSFGATKYESAADLGKVL